MGSKTGDNRGGRGIFITFEGIEGSGKTTLIGQVAGFLNRENIDPLLTREPGGTGLGAALRKVLLSPERAGMESMAELMLFGADRAQHVAEVVRPALAAGRMVLCDRFSEATIAYQGYGRGLPMEAVVAVDRAARGETRADLVILLDLPAEAGLSRARARNSEEAGPAETRIDEEELSFHRKVREGYLLLAKKDPGRFIVLDALQGPGELARAVFEELSRRFPHAF